MTRQSGIQGLIFQRMQTNGLIDTSALAVSVSLDLALADPTLDWEHVVFGAFHLDTFHLIIGTTVNILTIAPSPQTMHKFENIPTIIHSPHFLLQPIRQIHEHTNRLEDSVLTIQSPSVDDLIAEIGACGRSRGWECRRAGCVSVTATEGGGVVVEALGAVVGHSVAAGCTGFGC